MGIVLPSVEIPCRKSLFKSNNYSIAFEKKLPQLKGVTQRAFPSVAYTHFLGETDSSNMVDSSSPSSPNLSLLCFWRGNKNNKLLLNNVCCFLLSLHHFLVIYLKPSQIICRVMSGAEYHAFWQCVTQYPLPQKTCSSPFNRPGSKLWQIKCIKEKSLLVPF